MLPEGKLRRVASNYYCSSCDELPAMVSIRMRSIIIIIVVVVVTIKKMKVDNSPFYF